MIELRPKITINSSDFPYCYHRLMLANAGRDRCQIIYHLVYIGLTLERGGVPTRFDENPGIFQLMVRDQKSPIIMRPTFKQHVNPLIYEVVASMTNQSKGIASLAEKGARYEAFVDIPHTIITTHALSPKVIEHQTQASANFEEDIMGISMDDLEIG